MIPKTPFDVVVIGARCAGAATALLLARAGHRVLMVDRGRYGTDTVSTHALMRGAVLQLHRWDVLPAIIEAGTPAIRQATFYYGEQATSVPITARDGIDALYAPRRHVLDQILVDAAMAAGVEVVYGVHIRALHQTDRGRVTGVILEDEDGIVHSVQSGMVVGADGLRSTVARLAGAEMTRVGTHATGTMYGHWSGLNTDGYGWYFVQGVSAGAIPTNAGQTCVSVTVPGTEFTNLFAHRPNDAFQDLLWRVAPDLAQQVERAGETKLHGFAGHIGFLRRCHGPGWALVGDAGYFKDPLTAHGITDALRDAEMLADAIDAGSDRALAEYEDMRDAASQDLFEATDEMASFNWDLHGVRVLHERLAKAMSREVRQLVSA